ncbi:MAG: pyridoxal phosphate-dependent aminotransferase [Candidatus Krumholzibacteriota bacterium]|nr:pyridoxal phosphate-dependent aminotransferase [Candidatus Krumholzibacteriota bacterium]
MAGIVSKRARLIEPSITLSLNTKANALKEAGEDVVGLAAGEPDFQTPDIIKAAGIRAIEEGKTRYTPAAGIKQLREAVAGEYSRLLGVEYGWKEVVISHGAKHSIFNALFVLTDPGDEVLITTPYWVSYPEMIKLVGAEPRIIELGEETGYRLTVDHLKKQMETSRPKAILLNSPNNPAGIVYTPGELEDIGRFLLDEGIALISDEIYEFLVYGDAKHKSPVSLIPELKDQSVVITGVSKSYAMTGWRIGFALAADNTAFRMGAYQAHATGCPNAISQWAALEAVEKGNDDRDRMRAEFEKRKDMFGERLSRIPGISYPDPDGAFYFLTDVSSYYKACGVKGSGDFCEKLLKEKGLLVIPGGPFGCDNMIRFSFAAGIDQLNMALDRFESFIADYSK